MLWIRAAFSSLVEMSVNLNMLCTVVFGLTTFTLLCSSFMHTHYMIYTFTSTCKLLSTVRDRKVKKSNLQVLVT
ncbi:hypothetical protein AQUCO_01100118v1 [Aquilegia coerulea]|uniref:Uncharacterized protein n=1 Tax=Aquilegia coerulea TaxID=218851 RepID=A0A2G5E694_AQUCA|nr:hypothetical protein AQUCO_01100118v1 [Aquilegia coerulea]